MGKKLKRSSSDRLIAGVCGGFGEYFNIDPVIVRIIWALMVFWGGMGFLAYLICALIIPEDDGVIYQDDMTSSFNIGNTPIFIGLALIVFGGFRLIKNIRPQLALRFIRLGRYWPILLILLGLYIIYNQKNKR